MAMQCVPIDAPSSTYEVKSACLSLMLGDEQSPTAGFGRERLPRSAVLTTQPPPLWSRLS
jgi:hypothetical protein